MTVISEDYIQIQPVYAKAAAKILADAWKDPRLPMEQFHLSVIPEMERFRQGLPVEPFDSAVFALRQIPIYRGWKLLDVGAGSGFYSEVFRIASIPLEYTGVDFSESFVELGRNIYCGISLNIGDARCLNDYEDGSFDIVFSSACLLHIFEYKQALAEMVRVSRRFIILNKTPIVTEGLTTCFTKRAYGVACIEIHFAEAELYQLFDECGLRIRGLQMFPSRHRTYVLEKQ